jgi:hypothetical protein
MQDVVDLIPDDQKRPHIRALFQLPELVRTESEPLRFLRCERFDANPLDDLEVIGNSVVRTQTFYRLLFFFRTLYGAARRLVHYWEMRQKIFGDRAYIPMVLTGHGALTAEEVEQRSVATGKADWMKIPSIIGSPAKRAQLIYIYIYLIIPCSDQMCLLHALCCAGR